MYKLKTKKTVAKRFKMKKSGKIFKRKGLTSHLRSKESTSRRHRKKKSEEVSKNNVKTIKRLMPYG